VSEHREGYRPSRVACVSIGTVIGITLTKLTMLPHEKSPMNVDIKPALDLARETGRAEGDAALAECNRTLATCDAALDATEEQRKSSREVSDIWRKAAKREADRADQCEADRAPGHEWR